MGIRSPKAVRDQRAKLLEPLFAHMRLHRMTNRWVADQLGIPEKRLWAYKSGETRLPEGFIEQVCRVAGFLPSLISIPEPRDLYIQQPRTKKQPTTQPRQSTTATTTTRTKGRQTDERSRTDHHGNSGKHNGNGDGDGGDGHGGVTHRPDQPRRLRRPQRPPTPDYTATL